MKSKLLLAAAALLALTAQAQANSAGIFAKAETGCGGAGCHTGDGTQPTVRFEGANMAAAGQTLDLSFFVAGPQDADNSAAGANIKAQAGALSAGDSALRTFVGELTHNGGPLPFDSDEVEFLFSWTAPDAPGTYTIFGAGNSVNLNRLPSGDNWNTTTFQVTVGGGSEGEGGGGFMDAGPEPEGDATVEEEDGGGGGCAIVPGGAPASAPGLLLLALGTGLALRRRR